MPVVVKGLKEGDPEHGAGFRMWSHFDRQAGAEAISMRVVELYVGASISLHNSDSDEALYVIEGEGRATLDGATYRLTPDTGIFLQRGAALMVSSRSAGSMIIVSAQCPAPYRERRPAAPVVHLEDQPIRKTGDRWYREILTPALGSTEMTQFVGSIPPGRAPEHFHLYEEVICILDGSGILRSGEASTQVERGSCIFLPRRQPHCLENTGEGELRLLGVFHPAGSPAERY